LDELQPKHRAVFPLRGILGCTELDRLDELPGGAVRARSSGRDLWRSGYIWRWAAATFENWQSEFLQLLTFVVLTAYLIHKGSHESKDTDDEMMAILKRIERRLHTLESAAQTTAKR
jgi:hypothetical protein